MSETLITVSRISKIDLERALEAVEPRTNAARVREVMPVIERKLAAGVRLADLLEALRTAGLELTEASLRTYVYRHRKVQASGARPPEGMTKPPVPAGSAITTEPMTAFASMQHSPDSAPTPEAPPSAHQPDLVPPDQPLSAYELSSLVRPNQDESADRMAELMRLGKKKRDDERAARLKARGVI